MLEAGSKSTNGRVYGSGSGKKRDPENEVGTRFFSSYFFNGAKTIVKLMLIFYK